MARPRTRTIVAALLLAGCAHAPAPADPAAGVVVEHIDGDTVDIDFGGRVERVRLLGIDTPETVDPDQPVECGGPEASALLDRLLPPGTAVRVERDEEARDRYGRLLLYVFRDADDLFVNEALAAAGAADVLRIEPNDAYRDTIGRAVAEARRARTGMWGMCMEQ